MSKVIYINGKDHIAGRLASKLAKALLEGTEVHVFFTEDIKLAYPIERAKKIYESYLNKRCVVNPRKGVFHYVEPSKYFNRMVKRMIKYKTKKGALALKRLHCYESIPHEHYDKQLMVVPEATMKIKAHPKRKSVSFGTLLKTFGWKRYEAVEKDKLMYEEYVINENEIESEKKKRTEEMMKQEWFAKEVEMRMKSFE